MRSTGTPSPDSYRIRPQDCLALLMHGHLKSGYGKMGLGLLRYSEAEIAAVVDREHAGQDARELTGIPRSAPVVASVAEAAARGADVLVLGVATPGGVLPPGYWEEMKAGLAAGMSLVNGLHAPLASHPELAPLVRPGRFIWDVRKEPENLQNGTGAAAQLPARRVLTVGTDMAIGKMTAAIELDRAARRRGLRSRFLASGQIGICISGEGVALDAVRVDFASGAVEALVLRHGYENDILFLEGQGSVLHPASTAWLPLLRGGCPTDLILCHRAGQEAIARAPWVKIPPLREVAAVYEAVCAAGGALPAAKVVGIALLCVGLEDAAARRALEETGAETGLPVTDVVRFGADPLLDAILSRTP
ncbi:MAG TPA: DUF1611 domain-containing protein [Chthonomonadaceae bacterium]|nr:DUF1611 domain-containing protein [Chthonomonadaceae bacterium]